MNKVYVVINRASWGDNVSGTLVTPERGPMWSHVSSDLDWLKGDLTDRFGARRAELASMFGPEGYEVEVVGIDDPVPEPIAKWMSGGTTDGQA